jgi:hypothetical protein
MSLHDALLCGINFAILIDACHEFVISLFGFDFIWEPLFQEGGEFVVEVVYISVSYHVFLTFHPENLPEFASRTVGSRQNGQLCCLLFCMTIKHRMQKMWLHRNFTGRHLISIHMGQE